MPLFPNNLVVKDIVDSIYWADRMVRADLVLGLISGENDYTSNLTSTIRRQINSKNRPYLSATSLLLKPTVERDTGCDACIILSNTKEFKVCFFEAKWARLSTHKDYWDSLQKSTNLSHFSEQIKKQVPLSRSFAVWEMFYCEYPFGKQPSWIPNETSACVWHHDAYIQVQARNNALRWTDKELEDLLTDASSKYITQIDCMVKEVCLCNKGAVFTGNDYLRVFSDFELPTEVLLIEYSNPEEADG